MAPAESNGGRTIPEIYIYGDLNDMDGGNGDANMMRWRLWMLARVAYHDMRKAIRRRLRHHFGWRVASAHTLMLRRITATAKQGLTQVGANQRWFDPSSALGARMAYEEARDQMRDQHFMDLAASHISTASNQSGASIAGNITMLPGGYVFVGANVGTTPSVPPEVS